MGKGLYKTSSLLLKDECKEWRSKIWLLVFQRTIYKYTFTCHLDVGNVLAIINLVTIYTTTSETTIVAQTSYSFAMILHFSLTMIVLAVV